METTIKRVIFNVNDSNIQNLSVDFSINSKIKSQKNNGLEQGV